MHLVLGFLEEEQAYKDGNKHCEEILHHHLPSSYSLTIGEKN